MVSQVTRFAVEIQSAAAFETPELLAISDEDMNRLYAEAPELELYRLNIDRIRRRREHVLSDKEEAILAAAGEMAASPDDIYSMLSDADLKFPDAVDKDGSKRYDFQFQNKRGYKVTIEGLSEKFNKEYWNYAKLISGVLRYRMPIEQVIKLVGSLQLDSESINTWKNGVERALKKYITDGTEAKGKKCPNCGNETLVYQEGCLICTTCGASRCG